jgi:Carboxypeptidase regulatory-like domain
VRRSASAFAAMFLAMLAVLLGVSGASAVEDGPGLKGIISDSSGKAVPGVKISAEGGGFTGSATTDAKGAWAIELPKSGTYKVTLDTTSLPEGVSLTDPAASSRSVTVFSNPKTVLFPMGADTTVQESKLSRAVQLLVDGLVFGLVLALGAVGLSLIYGTTGLTNFAHGEPSEQSRPTSTTTSSDCIS